MTAVTADSEAAKETARARPRLDPFKKWMTVALVIHGAAVVALIKLLPCGNG